MFPVYPLKVNCLAIIGLLTFLQLTLDSQSQLLINVQNQVMRPPWILEILFQLVFGTGLGWQTRTLCGSGGNLLRVRAADCNAG